MSISKWYLIKSATGLSIRRSQVIDGKTKWERYPKDKYADMTEDEVRSFVNRLNVTNEIKEREAKKRYDFDHAFINVKVKEQFRQSIENNAYSHDWINAVMNYLDSYILEFFVLDKKTPDPKQWVQLEDEWGAWLLKKKMGKNTYRMVIQTANRFIKFLHKQYRDEVPLYNLEPIGKRKLDHIVAEKVLNEGVRKKYISEEEFKKVYEASRDRIKPMVFLGYFYGLRAAETFGVTVDDLFDDFLHIGKQLVRTLPRPQFAVLKGKLGRDIPHWFITPGEAYDAIKAREIIHPDTLSDWFSEDMERARLSYQFHDLRRSFITRAVREQNPFDVQRAAGHTDFKTTQGYIQDDRQLQRKKFIKK